MGAGGYTSIIFTAMNQIHEKDWAADDWGGYSGMRSVPYEASDPPESDDCSSDDSSAGGDSRPLAADARDQQP